MKFGGAYYCDECGCEIQPGTLCKECDPVHGVEEITYTFIATCPTPHEHSGTESAHEQATTHEDKPAWRRWLGW